MSYLLRKLSSFAFCLVLLGTAQGSDSILKDGSCYLLEIGTSGVYEIDGSWLNRTLGIELGSINVTNFKIYGVPGGKLSESSNWNETERLQEVPLYPLDDGNGILDQNDRILFYAEGASFWKYDSEKASYDFIKNPYSLSSYVVLKISQDPHSTIKDSSTIQPSNPNNEYLYRAVHHEDRINLLGASASHQGSGQEWFGEELSNVPTFSISSLLPKRLTNLGAAKIEVALVNRSNKTESLNLTSQGTSVESSIGPVNTADIESIYARKSSISLQLDVISPEQEINLLHQKNDNEARLWLDYVKVEGRDQIEFKGPTLHVNNITALRDGNDGLLLTNARNTQIWDVSNPFNTFQMGAHSTANEDVIIAIDQNSTQEIVILNPQRSQLVPLSGKLIDNQDIVEVEDIDMLIIYPNLLSAAATSLARRRSIYNNIAVHQVTVEEIYNEYAAGRMDPSAIRNYIRDLYNNGTGLKYVLLMGDASYDYRYLLTEFPDENLMPTYETQESLDPLLAFPSDDYYALLDDGENGELRGDLDVAIGRIIVRNQSEAATIVDKILRYENAQKSAGSWRTQLAFVADDEDNNLHINDADKIAEEVENSYPLFNQSKIYLDAFVQESTPGGNRYPSATSKLNQTINQGAKILNYLGHGGPYGWSQERVLKIDDITSWKNLDRLPLIITATCSITGIDDPALTTAGAAAFLQPNGGGIALFTTVRSVFASKNFRLTQSVFREIFEKEDGNYLPIGEVMRRAKNNIPNDNTNARKFFMIGDPSMRLNIPNYDVITSSINLKPSDNELNIVDTVGALDLVSITGEVRNDLGDIAQDFDGALDITVYDKPSFVSTLANDNGSFRKEYRSQNNVIYKGKVEVQDGIWESTFRIPVDINYSFGQAKISYYALSNDRIEATGYTKQLAIEGSSESVLNDDEGPDIQLFLNDRSFANGDIVGPLNVLLADISDDSGLNLSSASIGHELTAYIDNEPVILNEYFIPSLEKANSGTITYSLPQLSPGPHEISLQAFDVANNLGSAVIDFYVDDAFKNTISDVVVRPNPTQNIFVLSVNSDIRGDFVEMEVQFYDILGHLLQTQTQLTTKNNNQYEAQFEFRNKPTVIMAAIRLRDRNSDIETLPVFKKIIFLK